MSKTQPAGVDAELAWILNWAAQNDTTLHELRSADRSQPLATRRQRLMVDLYEQRRLTMPEIGWLLDRDHTTVLHAIHKHGSRPNRGMTGQPEDEAMIGLCVGCDGPVYDGTLCPSCAAVRR